MMLWLFTSMFVLYVGMALAVALFHPVETRRRHAADVLGRLLEFLDRRSSR
jgi:hypothetical protein